MMEHYRLGVVSFLNSRPLIYALEHDSRFELTYAVPSHLASMLDGREVDAALVPVVDMADPSRTWAVLSDACIGCDGETFTVRVFSQCAPDRITRLHVDGDSHTSVALARLIWKQHWNSDLEILPFEGVASSQDCEAILLIGDKVVNHGMIDLDVETDLGSAWKSMTGLPFVFAVWASPADADHEALAVLLEQSRDAGVEKADAIAETVAPYMGWPVELARRYLTRRLNFRLTPRHREGMLLFLELARKHDLIPQGPEPVFA